MSDDQPAFRRSARKPGRPSRINDRLDEDGPTVAERVVAAIRAGNYAETAAALAGVPKSTFYKWLKLGAQSRAAIAEGRVEPERLSDHEWDCINFSNDVEQATAHAEAADVASLARLARGGIKTEVETVKTDADGDVIERTVRTETSAPSTAALMWRLERRNPERWGRTRVEVSGPDGAAVPIEVRAAQIAASARSFHGEADTPDEANEDV